ncbi:cytochrome P450 [Auricularia subglabra TFB-10046 SS5]|uniref:Cytochrome P450 n=1 Tax=Auricularia subglabra (strain TFB-10046 / SS5) TaxID=717982 RepID=J0DBR6_AURST|nr:cytochrome P450 [Auricularia subglabra TFB-10046 SS5]
MTSVLLGVLPSVEPWSSRRVVLAASSYYLAYRLCRFAYAYWSHTRSPLRKLPGPCGDALWLIGHTRSLLSGENMDTQDNWLNTYGGTFSLRGLMGKYQLMTTDTRALTHICEQHRDQVLHTWSFVALSSRLTNSLSQRRIINPAFGYAHVRDMTEIFVDKAAKLREVWYNKCIEAGGSVRLNAIEWLSKATLASIGKAGFDYDFNTLNEHAPKNELAEAFDKVFRADESPGVILRVLLNAQFPILKRTLVLRFDESKRLIDEAGMRIVQEKKREILSELAAVERIEKKAVGGRDLISLLLRANLAQDLDPSLRLSDEEVLAQVPTFLVAGETQTFALNATSWAIYALATQPDVQQRLRSELQCVGTELPTLEQLSALPYLDHVARGGARRRRPRRDARPGQRRQHGFVPQVGYAVESRVFLTSLLSIKAGDEVLIPIAPLNRSETIWGPDADQFRPERWEDVPPGASTIPGITPNLMSFIGGPRSCVGHRFAVAEMKALLFHVVRGFEFTLAVDPSELFTRSGGILRPQLRADKSVTLPVVLTLVA